MISVISSSSSEAVKGPMRIVEARSQLSLFDGEMPPRDLVPQGKGGPEGTFGVRDARTRDVA